MKKKKVLTFAAVKNFRPGAKRRAILDGGARSLYLVVYPSGKKSWVMRFRRPGGKVGRLNLGPLDLSGREATGDPVIGTPLTLAAARQLSAQIHRARLTSSDVIADYLAVKHRHRDAEREGEATTRAAAAVRAFVESNGTADDDANNTKGVSVVYFVAIGTRAVKIGVTTRLERRLADLRAASVEKTSLLAVMPGARDLEQKFHRAFAGARISNEFFRADTITKFLGDLGNAALCVAAS
jgi:Meiotically Up-regulated Gene 113 (MUG113) protein/Arm domain-containing DNA-binding protein